MDQTLTLHFSVRGGFVFEENGTAVYKKEESILGNKQVDALPRAPAPAAPTGLLHHVLTLRESFIAYSFVQQVLIRNLLSREPFKGKYLALCYLVSKLSQHQHPNRTAYKR